MLGNNTNTHSNAQLVSAERTSSTGTENKQGAGHRAMAHMAAAMD